MGVVVHASDPPASRAQAQTLKILDLPEVGRDFKAKLGNLLTPSPQKKVKRSWCHTPLQEAEAGGFLASLDYKDPISKNNNRVKISWHGVMHLY